MKYDFSVPMIFDGAFGTFYFSQTSDTKPCELANINAPQTVEAIHRAYIQAGADAIKTNTFGAATLAYREPQRLKALIRAGWQAATLAARDTQVRVFADIGGIDTEDAPQAYLAAVQIFLELGAKHFLFETLDSFDDLSPSLSLIQSSAPDAMVIASFAVSQDGYSKRGLYYKSLLRQAADHCAVNATGLNCVCGPSHLLRLLQSVTDVNKPICAMPNAGYPSSLNGRVLFEDNAEYFAQRLSELYLLGADILGGCCGTTPRHIELAAKMIRQTKRMPTARSAAEAVQAAYHSENSQHCGQRKKIAVELDPPINCDCSFLLSAAKQLQADGVDLVTLADSPLSRTRADSLMTAAKIKREVGIEVLPHLSCRDKNHIALKAGLLAASFEEINRVLVITGDPPMQSELRKPDGVFSFNSYDLIAYINGMNSDVFSQNPFLIGAALNVNAVNFSVELARAEKKLARGARVLFSQPIFSDAAVENFWHARRTLDCTLFAGILPVAGYKNAVFLMNEVSGIEIPKQVVEALYDKTPEQAAQISIAYSTEMIKRVNAAADGFYLMTPLKRVDIIHGLIQEIRRI